MSEELVASPVEDIAVQRCTTPANPKVGTKEFCEALGKELSDGKVWRSSKALAENLNVDVVELDKYLRLQQSVCSKASKEEGVFLYALTKRMEAPQPVAETVMRPLVTEEDRYALASLHSAFILLESTLQKYLMKIHERNPEAFTQLMAGKDKLEAGIVLYGIKLKADMSKLPKV